MKTKFLMYLFSVILAIYPSISNAQPGFDDDVTDDVPVDGGISILLAAGIGYGAKRMADKRKNKRNC